MGDGEIDGKELVRIYRDQETEPVKSIFAPAAWWPFADVILPRKISLDVSDITIYDLEGHGRDAVLIRPEDLNGKVFGDTVLARVMYHEKNQEEKPVSNARHVSEMEIVFRPIPPLQQALFELVFLPGNG